MSNKTIYLAKCPECRKVREIGFSYYTSETGEEVINEINSYCKECRDKLSVKRR